MSVRSYHSFLLLLLLTGCQLEEPAKPVAKFIVTGDNCIGPCTISFTDASENTSVYTWNYLWDFGDGSSSPERNPKHVYTTAGAFVVSLSLNGKYGSATYSDTVQINSLPTPIADFTFTQDTTSTDSTVLLRFKNKSANATGYEWDFGDKKKDTLSNPVHIYKRYKTDSSYVIALKAIGAGNAFSVKADTLLIKRKKKK